MQKNPEEIAEILSDFLEDCPEYGILSNNCCHWADRFKAIGSERFARMGQPSCDYGSGCQWFASLGPTPLWAAATVIQRHRSPIILAIA
jgi:hypothetical protein